MTSTPGPTTDGEPDAGDGTSTASALGEALEQALGAGTREAFTAMLTDDVRWGGEQRGTPNECLTRGQAGLSYAGLLARGVTLRIDDLRPVDPGRLDAAAGVTAVFTARLQVRPPDPDDFPPHVNVRLSLRGRLISEICVLDETVGVEVLYFDGCPHFETFLPHLRELLAEHGITAPVTLTRVDGDGDAQALRFLGSPTVRVGGIDVEPAAAERHPLTALRHDADDDARRGSYDADAGYGMQCRLYATTDGGTIGTPRDQWILDALVDNPTHEAAIAAVRTGDLYALQQLLDDHPDLAATRLPRHEGRTLLHIATDWPGHHPGVAATIAALVAAGADPDRGCLGEHPETPLHWAASSDDLAAIDALLDAGADPDAPGAVIGGGTAMADATAFGQWDAARRLLERGATTNLFEAAALGLVDRVEADLATNDPTTEDITSSLWGAAHGGHIGTAAVLLAAGADINWVGYDGLTPLDAARRSDAPDAAGWLERHGGTTADAITN